MCSRITLRSVRVGGGGFGEREGRFEWITRYTGLGGVHQHQTISSHQIFARAAPDQQLAKGGLLLRATSSLVLVRIHHHTACAAPDQQLARGGLLLHATSLVLVHVHHPSCTAPDPFNGQEAACSCTPRHVPRSTSHQRHPSSPWLGGANPMCGNRYVYFPPPPPQPSSPGALT